MSAQSKTALKSTIDTDITTNGTNSITGAQVNDIMNDMVDSYEDLIASYSYTDLLAIASPVAGQKILVTDFPNSGNKTIFIYTGTYWKQCCCCVVLNVNATQTGTDADLLEKTLATYSLPANYMYRDLDYIEWKITGQFAANTNAKQVKFYFGSSSYTVAPSGSDANSKYWEAYFKIIRTGATTQVITGNFNLRPRAGGVISVIGEGAKSSGGETLSSAVTIKVTGTNGTAAANDILFDEWTLTFHRK